MTDRNNPRFLAQIRVVHLAEGCEISPTQTDPLPLDAFAGNIFVANGFGLPSPPDCGDLSNPCLDIKTGISRAAPGATVFVTPGVCVCAL